MSVQAEPSLELALEYSRRSPTAANADSWCGAIALCPKQPKMNQKTAQVRQCDRAAIEFAIGFYDGLLAGRAVDFAFKLGCSAIQMEEIPERLTPTLKQKQTKNLDF